MINTRVVSRKKHKEMKKKTYWQSGRTCTGDATASGWNPESAGGSRVSSRSTDVATLSRPEHLRININ